MPDRGAEHYSPTCMLSHHFINQLSAIVGNCDILKDRSERAEAPDPDCVRRLAVIRDIALALITEMRECAGDLDLQAKAAVLCRTLQGIKR